MLCTTNYHNSDTNHTRVLHFHNKLFLFFLFYITQRMKSPLEMVSTCAVAPLLNINFSTFNKAKLTFISEGKGQNYSLASPTCVCRL